MNFPEASMIAEIGDRLQLDLETGSAKKSDKQIILTKGNEWNHFFSMSWECYWNENWQIIKAEPKVLTAEEMYKKMGMATHQATQINNCVYGNAMHQNGRLEEWLNHKELREAVAVMGRTDEPGYSIRRAIYTALENIKPLKQ